MWRQYWDYQLFKALEYQYTQGLECINKTLPEVEVKMVFRQHKLQVGEEGKGGERWMVEARPGQGVRNYNMYIRL